VSGVADQRADDRSRGADEERIAVHRDVAREPVDERADDDLAELRVSAVGSRVGRESDGGTDGGTSEQADAGALPCASLNATTHLEPRDTRSCNGE